MTSPSKQPNNSADTVDNGGTNGTSIQIPQDQFTMPMEVFRELYKTEIHVLWQEVERFRKSCQRQMAKHRMLLTEHRIRCEEEYGGHYSLHSAPDLPNDFSRELRKLEENMTFLDTKESPNQKSRDIIDEGPAPSSQSTNSLAAPPTKDESKVEETPKTVQVPSSSDSNHDTAAAGDPVEQETVVLKEDILKVELARSLKHLESTDSDSQSYATGQETLSDTTASSYNETSNKARKHWMIARKHLVDKLALLETTVKRYRSELAAATMTITAKDMEISQLNKQVSELRGEAKKKDRKIEELEGRLKNTLEDKNRSDRNLELFMDELQNIELHTSTIAVEEEREPPHPPIKQQPSFKQRLLRKQHSSLSFFGPSKDKSSRSRLGETASPGASGESTPDNESPQLKRRSSHPPVAEDLNSNGAKDINSRQIINEILGKGRMTDIDEQTGEKRQYGDDNSSRACAVM